MEKAMQFVAGVLRKSDLERLLLIVDNPQPHFESLGTGLQNVIVGSLGPIAARKQTRETLREERNRTQRTLDSHHSRLAVRTIVDHAHTRGIDHLDGNTRYGFRCNRMCLLVARRRQLDRSR